MASQCHGAFPSANIPDLGGGVAGAGDEHVRVDRGKDREGHDVSLVVGEGGLRLAQFNVPEHAEGVSRGGQNRTFVEESAAGKVAIVVGQLAVGTHHLRLVELVDGAEVVESSACDEVAFGGFEGAGHDPGRAEGNGLELDVLHGRPDDEFAILRGGDEVGGVSRPVHGVDLSKVTF